jgi:molybdate transport system substrate-binding protein
MRLVLISTRVFLHRLVLLAFAGVMAMAATAVPVNARAQDLAIAAASDLQSVLPTIAKRFEEQTGRHVALTFGSSGNFFTQIQSGAPFDLFFSADVDYVARLEKEGRAEPGSQFRYAVGRIALWTRRDSGIDVSEGLSVLVNPRVRRVAIANPAHAPYGRAAVSALQHEKLYDAVKTKLVLGENISQAAQFAQSGNADVGIVALSLARGPALESAGTFFDIPERFHPRIDQAAIIVRASKQKAVARQFLDFLKQPEIVKLFQDFGFTTP